VSRWRSVVGGEAHAPDAGPTALSLEDVAYGRLLDAARRVARRTGAAYGLGEAIPDTASSGTTSSGTARPGARSAARSPR